MKHKLVNCDNVAYLWNAFHLGERYSMVFGDPPDAIGLKYDVFDDHINMLDYYNLTRNWMTAALRVSNTLWWSFNSRHAHLVGSVVFHMIDVECKPCVQTFTFGNHQRSDLTNNHRLLWCVTRKGTRKFNIVKEPSWRESNGDKRAKPGGKMVSDVFDFPRVTGNSKQRRPWHVTQLNEGLVERCILLSTNEGDRVLDMFGGTGTTLRACKSTGRECTLLELSPNYCAHIAEEHSLEVLKLGET